MQEESTCATAAQGQIYLAIMASWLRTTGLALYYLHYCKLRAPVFDQDIFVITPVQTQSKRMARAPKSLQSEYGMRAGGSSTGKQ